MQPATHPKIQIIVEAIQRNEVSVALKNINSLMAKQKTKDKFASETLELFNLLKALCQVKSHQFGEAKQIFLNYIESHMNNFSGDPEVTLWLHSIGTNLNMYHEMRKLFEPLSLKNTKDEKLTVEYIYLALREYDFKAAQSNSLKLYKIYNTKTKYMIYNIFFQYLGIIKGPNQANKVKDLELPLMFINKLIKDLKFDDPKNVLKDNMGKSIIKLATKILKHQDKYDKLFEELTKYHEIFQNDDNFIHYLIWIFKQNPKPHYLITLTNALFKIFAENYNLKNYRFCYNLYELFIDNALELIPKDYKDFDFVLNEVEKSFEFEQISEAEADLTVILKLFWNGLDSSHKKLINEQKTDPNYLYAIKTVLNSKLYFLREVILRFKLEKSSRFHQLIAKLLINYSENFLSTFTYADEVLKYYNLLSKEDITETLNQCRAKITDAKLISKCIGDINLTKLTGFYEINEKSLTLELLHQIIDGLIIKYTTSMNEIYNNSKVVEKGERLANDDYLIIITDIVLSYLRQFEYNQLDENHLNLIIRTILISEIGLNKTSYNFDLKLRLMQLYQLLGITDKYLDIYRTLDIKSIQLDTLGYLFFQPFSSFSLYDPIVELIKDNLSYQIENWKESKEV